MNKSLIEELIGTDEGMDQHDTFLFTFYKCSKFNGRTCSIHFELGILEVYSEDGSIVENSFRIHATLVKE